MQGVLGSPQRITLCATQILLQSCMHLRLPVWLLHMGISSSKDKGYTHRCTRLPASSSSWRPECSLVRRCSWSSSFSMASSMPVMPRTCPGLELHKACRGMGMLTAAGPSCDACMEPC